MDRGDREWDLVVKVKYGDSLRRFNACVHGTSMDTNMEKLREKIINLFNLSPDVDIIMTYTDVDGDLVTLVNDDELQDAVVCQHLNPLRINVQLNANNATNNTDAKSHSTNSSEFSTSQSLPMNFTLSEALKSVPEPIGSAISKLSQDIVSKTVESAPAITAIVEHLTKLGLSRAVSPHATLQGDLPVNNGGIPADLPNLEVCSSAKPVDPSLENKEKQPETAAAATADCHKKDASQWSRELATNTAQLPTSLIDQDQNFEVNKHQPSTTCDHGLTISALDQIKNKSPAVPDFNCNTGVVSGTNRQLGHVMAPPIFPSSSFCRARFRGRSNVHHDDSPRVFHCGVQCDNCGMHPIVGVRYKSNVKENYDLCSICFAEMGSDVDYTRIDRPFQNRNFGCHGFRGRGMRYNRTKLESRFIQDITIMDGTLMPPCIPFTKIWKLQNNGSTPWPVGTQLIWIGGDNFSDTTAVQLEIPVNGFPAGAEINIAVDFVAPATLGRYVSYWRLCSPSGQKFGQRVWVLIQVDANSCVDGYLPSELNLNLPPVITGLNGTSITNNSVEYLCGSEPDISGANAEHIKLSTDSGPDKGFQSVPVRDSVIANNEFTEVVPEIPLATVPLGNSSSVLSTTIWGNTVVTSYPDFGSSSDQPIASASFPLHELVDTARGTGDNMTDSSDNHINDLSQLSANSIQGKTPTISYPVVDSSLESTITSTTMVPLSSYPSIDLLPPSTTSSMTFPMISVNQPSGDVPNNSTAAQAEQALLKELYEMGFKQVDLNKEILRKNEYDLEQSLNDLCDDGWDLLLEELQEMGFVDRELNKKLLIKNNGSIKHVVLDLIAREKAE